MLLLPMVGASNLGGLNNYQYYLGGSLLSFSHKGPQNPILIIKAPVLQYCKGFESLLLRDWSGMSCRARSEVEPALIFCDRL